MAIDKIKLRRLVKDKDERFFEEGDILDALNVVTSAYDGIDGGVVKNVRGTSFGTPVSESDRIPNEESRVVGSVSDNARGYVYFFVWSTTASNHGIYQYYPPNNTYRLVLRNSILAFEKHGFVNADLINGEFETDSTQQTILYFTDNVNPPRKINVDKFLSNTFNVSLYSDQQIFEMISAAKTPVLFPPQVSLGTDDTRSENNLYGSTYQFSVQVKYKDGELSAISPHSEIIYPKYMAIQGVEQSNTDLGVLAQDNFIYVDTRWNTLPVDFSYYKEDVDEIKLLVRENNTGNFRLVDSFDPNENLVRNGNTIYTAIDGVYRFYNDGVYANVSVNETDKIYDDVPQKATSQAIVANRLMYSSPTSGYPNTDVSATFSVNYLPSPTATYATGVNEATGAFSVTQSPSSTNKGSVKVDYSSLPANISAGSIITIEFDFKPADINHFGYDAANSADTPLLKVKFGSTPYSNDVILFAGQANDSQNDDFAGSLNINLSTENQSNTNNTRPGNINWEKLRASVTLTETLSRVDAMELLVEEIKQQVLSYQYNSPSETMVWKLRDSSGSEAGQIEFSLLKFDLKFLVAHVSASEYILLTPRIGNYFIPSGETSSSAGFLQSPSLSFYDEWDDIGYPTHTGNYSYFNGIEDNLNPTFLTGTAYQRDGVWFNLSPNSAVGYSYGYYSYGLNSTTPVVNGFREEALTINPTDAVRTFKAGCDHAFGIVYFDRHGRSGFVNELGIVSVAPFGDIAEREDPDNAGNYFNGPCEISIDLNGTPPDWAVAYQIVYSDMVTWEKFESYSVGGGFFETTNDNHISVSFNTLLEYQSDKGAIKDYLFTPGDKLRVISYKPSVNTSQVGDLDFPSDPSDYTFDISEYKTEINDIENPSTPNQTDSNHVGKFLLLAKPFGNNPASFTPDLSPNLWQNKCVVEILTPRKERTEMVYYEIGEARRIYKSSELTNSSNDRHNDGNPIVTNQGSVYFKPVSIFVPQWNGQSWQIEDINTFDYETRMLESSSVSDFISSKVWSKGRAHVPYDRADTINYYNRIVYSDEMGDDIGGLTFSSFNPGALSYKNLPKNYGAIKYIGNYNQSVAALQENKLSYIPVQRNVIEYADGDSSITVGREVMGQHQESNGDFGCGSDQSSVLLRDGILFFVDRSRRKVLAAAGGQLKAISDIDMSSYFEGEIDSVTAASGEGGRIITGYDPEEDMLFFTIEPKKYGSSITYPGTTVGYSVGENAWISRYSFVPSNYATIDNTLLSCKWHQNLAQTNSYLFNKHTNQKKNTFYGEEFNTEVEVISKISPSEVKVFNAISYEGSSSNWIMPAGATTDLGQTSGVVDSWSQKEGSYYSVMPKDVAYKYVYIGTISSSGINIGSGLVQLDDITRLDRFPFKLNSELIFWYDGLAYNELAPSGTVLSYDLSLKQITTSELTSSEANGKKLFFRLSTDGNAMRGHWMRVKISNDSVSSHELYCINTHIADSKSHHPKGQQ